MRCRVRNEMSLLPDSAPAGGASSEPMFKFARCVRPLTEDMRLLKGTPLPSELVEVVFAQVPWEAFAVRCCAFVRCFSPV